MTDIAELPTIAERLASAGNTSDLTVEPDRRRPVDVLIAAGLAPSVVGRLIDQLVSEWDGCAKPRRLAKSDIERLAASMPRVSTPGRAGERLDIAAATTCAAAWYDSERTATVLKLKTLPKLLRPNVGLVPWLAAKGVSASEAVLLDVLAWYLDRCCPACNGTRWQTIAGTNRQGAKACGKCRGSGESVIPHERIGKDIVWHLEKCASHARSGTKAVLANMKALKNYAVGR